MPVAANDMCVIIPLRIDSPDRTRNLGYSLTFLRKEFSHLEIIVIEHDRKSQCKDTTEFHGATYIFEYSESNFRKPHVINVAARHTERDIIFVYDADMIANVSGIIHALKIIRNRSYPIAVPFNRICIDVEQPLIDQLGREGDGSKFGNFRSLANMHLPQQAKARVIVGALLMFDRRVFEIVGGMNTEMHGYGWEDVEIFTRARKLGYFHVFSPYSATHLNHHRGPDSSIGDRYSINRAILDRVSKMTSPQLRRYVATVLRPGSAESIRIDQPFSASIFHFLVSWILNRVEVEGGWRLLGGASSKAIRVARRFFGQNGKARGPGA